MAIAYTSVSALKTYMGVSDTNDDAAFTAIATAVNAIIEDYIGAGIGDGGTAIRTYDGDGSDRLFVRGGVNSITTLEVADQTGGTFTTAGTASYVIRPHTYERPTGWPGWYVQLTDVATTTFTPGYDTVRITPGTAWGFTSTPQELSRIADIMGVRMFQARKSGETLLVGSTDYGQVMTRFLPESEYRDILDHYAYTVGGRRRVT
jgi:hypothetical protein